MHDLSPSQPQPQSGLRPPSSPKRLGVLISGSGRTLLNLLDCQHRHALSATVVGVISSKARTASNAGVFDRCAAEGIPMRVIRPADFSADAPSAFAEAQTAQLAEWGVDLVVMAGYLKFWPIPDEFRFRVMNIHPSLLPRHGGRGFYGLRVHEAVLSANEGESGCTVHFVDNIYDRGPIILQRRVPVLQNDTPDALAARVFAEECVAYPEAINLFADDRLTVVADSTTPSGFRVAIRPTLDHVR